MNRVRWSALLVGLGGVACAPLQQAPLVYSSKIAVGVDISATSTEAPGFGFVVGYKQVDAAYVPVAVALPCDPSAAGAKCDTQTYALKELNGTSLTEGERRSGPTVERAKLALKDYGLAQEAAFDARRQVSDLDKRIADVQQRIAKLAAGAGAPAAAAGADAAASAPPAGNDPPPGAEELNRQRESLIKERAAAESRRLEAEKRAKALEPEAEVAQQFLDKLTQRDAYSVFGRFEGDITGGTDQGRVSLGKVFSTGVASQNLTAGLRKYYEGLTASACFEAVAKLNLADDKEKLRLLAACQPAAKP
jgi:hypothetical protein